MGKVIRYKNITVGQAENIVNAVETHPIVSKTIKRHKRQLNSVRLGESTLKIKAYKSHHVLRKVRNARRQLKRIRKVTVGTARHIGRFTKHTTEVVVSTSDCIGQDLSKEVARLNRAGFNTVKGVNQTRKTVRRTINKAKRKEWENNRISVKFKYKKNKANSRTPISSKTSPNQKRITKTKKVNSPLNNPSKNPNIKKKTTKYAQRTINKVHKSRKSSKLVKAVKFSYKAIKKLIIAIGGMAFSFLGFIIIIGAILLMISSPFGILLDDNPKTMRQQINEYFSDYRDDVNNRIKMELLKPIYSTPEDYNTDNDRIRIIGPSPEVKEVLKLYIVRNESDPDGDVLIDTENFKLNKFKEAFSDLNSIYFPPTVIENTREVTVKKSNGKTETITVLDSRDITFTQTSETALAYAIRTKMSEDSINIIKELGDPEFDKAWENLLYGVQTFSYITPGTMPYFNQGDYSHISYGPGSLASDGCGPTAFAMVVSYLKGTTIAPDEIIKWCGNDYYAWPDSGTCWNFFEDAANHYGIRCDNAGATFGEAIDALKQGKVVISIQGPGLFTSGGHFIVLRAITPEGKILVSDPNGWNANKWGLTIEEYTAKEWEQDQISAAATNYWIFSSDMSIGGNPAEVVWLTLRAHGYSKEVVAGIIGNMMAECGGQTLDLDWDIHGYFNGDTFYGLCQWCLLYTPSWFDGCSVQDQLNYLMGDIKSQFDNYGSNYSSGYNYNSFINARTVDEAAAAFAACYERPGYEYNNYEVRRENAKTAYKYFHNK